MAARFRGRGAGVAAGRGKGRGPRVVPARTVQLETAVQEVDSLKMEELNPGPECIRVTGFPDTTTEDSLLEELSSYGAVRRCKVPRNGRGVGYVWFEDVSVANMLKDAAAVEAFSTVLEVTQARGAKPLRPVPQQVARRQPVAQTVLRQPAAAVVPKVVRQPKAAKAAKVVAVVPKPVVLTKPVVPVVVDADKLEERNPGLDCLKVSGVPVTCTEEELGESLSVYGAVRRVKIPKQKIPGLPAVAYVWFTSEETADYCKGLGKVDALGTALEFAAAPGARPLSGKGKGKGKGKGAAKGKGKGKGAGKAGGKGGNPYKRARY